MVALPLVAFLVYLYAPHLLFKFAANLKYDFVSPKQVSQVEEFFAAGLPSAVLNAVTWLVFLAWGRIGHRGRVLVDPRPIAEIFAHDPDLRAYFARGGFEPLLRYVLALFLISYVAGYLYGWTLVRIARSGGPLEYFTSAQPLQVPGRILRLLYRKIWRPFYAVYEHPIFPKILQQAYAFVHTNHGLYHGIFWEYDKTNEGEVAGIYLVEVSKFSRRSERECIRDGVNPISDMDGPLYIAWSDVLDINYPPDASTLKRKRDEYERRLEEAEKLKLREREPRFASALRVLFRGTGARRRNDG